MTLTGFNRRRRLAAAKLAQAEALAAEEAERAASEASADPKPVPLAKLNKPALEAMAIEQGIDPAGLTKAQIIDALSAEASESAELEGGEQAEHGTADGTAEGQQSEGDGESDGNDQEPPQDPQE